MASFKTFKFVFLQACVALLVAGLAESSTLFEEGTVISFDDASQSVKVLRNTSVLVVDDRITAIFDAGSQNVTIPADAERVSVRGKIISPGFIDTHRHGWQSAYRTIVSNTTLGEYLVRYGEFSQAQTIFTPDDVYYGQLVSAYESLNSGVTSILEHAHGTWSNETSASYLDASIDSGIRMWWAYAVHELSNGFSIQEQLVNFKDLRTSEKLANQSVVQIGMAYDFAGLASAEQDALVLGVARDSNLSVFTLHDVGGPFGYENAPARLQALDFINTTFPIVFSHSAYLTVGGAKIIRDNNHYVSITPESEMHYGHGHENSPNIQDQSALGIDTHSTYSADIITQARLWLQATRLKMFYRTLDFWEVPTTNPMSVNQAFLLATRAGGLALRRPDLGVIQVGAKADLAIFDGDSPNMLGWSDPVAAVILHSNVGDVKHVLVDGQWRKRDGELVLNQNRTEVEQLFLQSARRIQDVWANTPPTVLSGQSAAGANYAPTRFQDVIRGEGDGY
ncbi:amidohydrolase [Phlyctema vagabunda]|uniref:Amidohydrolase n=1 Tax=Phlyctema vagabunda TaxID=108571 RepID=A0ABR4PBA2_9HELO